MKKFAYLLTMVFVLAFATTSCEKDENDDSKTLEELYPEWSYLYGKAPEVSGGIPTITITIEENVGTIEQYLPQISVSPNPTYTRSFNTLVISGNTVTLMDGQSIVASGTFTKSGSEILTITTSGRAMPEYSATYEF